MTLRERLDNLGLHAMVEHFDQISEAEWLPWLIEQEERERQRRSLERRRKMARLGRFKAMTDFDWDWPERMDRKLVDELFGLRFVEQGLNVVLVGPNGVGKTMVAKNLGSACLNEGHSVRFTTASHMLNQLAAEDSATKAFEEPVPTRMITTDRRGADNHRRSAWRGEHERSGGGW